MHKVLPIFIFLLMSIAAAAQGVFPTEPERPAASRLISGPQQRDVEVENALLDIVALLDEGNYAIADRDLDSLSKAYPDNDAVQYYYGVSRFSLRDPRGAATRLEKAVELDSTNTWYKETLATVYSTIGDGAGAGRIYLDLSRQNPKKYRNAYTLTLIADAYRMQDDFPNYFATLKTFVQDGAVSAEAKSKYLGTTLSNFPQAKFRSLLPQIDSLMQVFVEAEPKAPESHALRMEIAGYREDWQTIIDECYAQIDLNPSDKAKVVSLGGYIGDCYHQLGNARECYRVYREVLKIDPDYCPVLNNYAYYLSEEHKNLSKAAKMSLRTIELEPDNPTYLDTYGWILYLQRKYKDAKPHFKHAMIYGGKESEVILRHYAQVLDALGETDLSAYYRNLADAKKK